MQGRCDRAKTHKGRAASPRSPVPRIPGNPSRSPQRNGQTRSEPAKADNRADITRTHKWRSRPGGTGTQDTASRPVWRKAANSRRETRTKRRDRNAKPGDAERKARRQRCNAGRCRGQNAATGTQRRAMPRAKRRDRNARPGDAEGKAPQRKRKAGRCRGQSAATGTQGRAMPSAKRGDRNATPGDAERKTPQEKRNAAQDSPRAHKRLCRSYNRPNATLRRRTIHYPVMQSNTAPRQRGRGIDGDFLRHAPRTADERCETSPRKQRGCGQYAMRADARLLPHTRRGVRPTALERRRGR